MTRAINGGWKHWSEFPECWLYDEDEDVFRDPDRGTYQIEAIIFNHDFAKALWGTGDTPNKLYWDRKYASGTGGPEYDAFDGELWEFHLQQMVIAPDPLKYLGDNI